MNEPRQPARGGDEVEITLGLLHAVHENAEHTQRSLAGELGIALGLANAYLKRCIKKGFIKVREAPARRYAYYLTPHGFSEKSRLTAEYLSQSLLFFREARGQYRALLEACDRAGWQRIALAGISDVSDVVQLYARDYPALKLVALLDADAPGPTHAGLKVVRALVAEDADAVIITDLAAPQQTFDSLRGPFAEERLLTPDFLKISRDGPPVV